MGLDITTLFQPLFLIKGVILLLIVFYLVFSIVVFLQIRTMNKIVHAPPLSQIAEILGILHIGLVLSLFLISFGIL